MLSFEMLAVSLMADHLLAYADDLDFSDMIRYDKYYGLSILLLRYLEMASECQLPTEYKQQL